MPPAASLGSDAEATDAADTADAQHAAAHDDADVSVEEAAKLEGKFASWHLLPVPHPDGETENAMTPEERAASAAQKREEQSLESGGGDSSKSGGVGGGDARGAYAARRAKAKEKEKAKGG